MSRMYKVVGACALITQQNVNGPTKISMTGGAVFDGDQATALELRHNLEMGLIAPFDGDVAGQPVVDVSVDQPPADDDPAAANGEQPDIGGDGAGGEAGDGGAGEAGDGPAAGTPGEAGEKPAQADNKAAWVEYAVARGVDRGEAEKASKADLIGMFK